MSSGSAADFDVALLGGGLAASLFAISLLRERPGTRIAIIEQSSAFPKKVGESTSDVTALFLRRFGIENELSAQLPKAGLRFLFTSNENTTLEQSSDYSGPSFRSIVNGYQLQRATFDQSLLDRAVSMGAKLFRPASVQSFEYAPSAAPFFSKVSFHSPEGPRTISARWLVDASGRRGIVAHEMGWRMLSKTHQTASSWAHFEGMTPIPQLDGLAASMWDRAITTRQDATTHFMGKGYWVWHIPLSDGTVSLGVVFDKTLLPSLTQDPERAFFDFLARHPTLGVLTHSASWKGFKHLPHLPYESKKYLAPGLALIGDAAAFVDPLFSPGIELTCQQILAIAPMIAEHLESGRSHERKWARFDRKFAQVVRTRFYLYENRYRIMADYEAHSVMSQMDIAGYYTATIIPSVLFPRRLVRPTSFNFITSVLYRLFKGRLLTLVEAREQSGLTRVANTGRRSYSHTRIQRNPLILLRPAVMFGLGLLRYLRLEWETARSMLGFRTLERASSSQGRPGSAIQ